MKTISTGTVPTYSQARKRPITLGVVGTRHFHAGRRVADGLEIDVRDDELVDRVVQADARQQRDQFDDRESEHHQQRHRERRAAGRGEPLDHACPALSWASRSAMRFLRVSSSSSASFAAVASAVPDVPCNPV